MTRDKLKMLDEEGIELALAAAMQIVGETPPGRYKLSVLFGDQWQWVRRRRLFGQWFRAWVRAGLFPRVRWVRKRSDRSHEYEVLS